MMLRLLRMDPALDGLRTAALVSLGLGVFLRIFGETEMHQAAFVQHPVDVWRVVQTLLTWTLIAAAVAGSKAWIKTPRFYLGLPIATRTMFRVRALGMTLGLLFVHVVLVIAATVEVGGPALLRFHPEAVEAGAVFWSMSLLVTALLFRIEGHVRRASMSAPVIILLGLFWLLAVLSSMFLPWRWFVALPFGALALILFVFQDRGLPTAFDLELQGPASAIDPEADVASGDNHAPAPPPRLEAMPAARSSFRLMTGALLRLMHHHWQGYLFLFIMVIYGMAVTHDFLEGDDTLFYSIYTGMFAMSMIHHALLRIHPMDGLPVSRRRMFVLAAAPGVLAVVLGGFVGTLTSGVEDAYVFHGVDQVRVPHEFFEIADDGVVPETVTPWGATYRPQGFRFRPWSPAVLYRPYEHGPEADPRLKRLLARRAVARVHGLPLVEFDISAEPVKTGAPAPESHGRGSMLRSRTMAAAAMVMTALIGVFGILSLQAYHARWAVRRKRWTAAVGTGVPVAIFLAMLASQEFGFAPMWVSAAAPMVELRRLTEAVGGAPSAWWWGSCGVWLLTIWAVMEAFVRVEAVGDWMKKKKREDF